jgi:hypothetical protein
MTATVSINLVELLSRPRQVEETVLFEDGYFSRRRISVKCAPFVDMDIMPDCIDSLNVKCFYLSLKSTQEARIEFAFADAQITSYQRGKLITDQERKGLF